MVTFAWLTTAPHPRKRAHRHGADQGQVGWKLHAVPAKAGEPLEELRQRAAFCGTVPRHGWGLDLFIDAECSRCRAVMEKTGKTYKEIGS